MFRCCFLFFCLISQIIFGQETSEKDFDFDAPILKIKENFQKETIGRYLTVLVCENKPSLARIMRDSTNYPFKQNYTEVLDFIPQKLETAYWVTFKIRNETQIHKELVLELDNPLISEVEFFEISNQERFSNHNATGSKFDFGTRQINHRNFLFRIGLNPSEEKQYYVYVSNHGRQLYLPLHIFAQESFAHQNYITQTWIGWFCGFCFFAFVLAFALYLKLQKTIFLYFGIYVLSLNLMVLSNNGLAYQVFWSNYPAWNENASFIMVYLNGFGLLQVCYFFLIEQKITPFLPKIIYNIAVFLLICMVLSFLFIYFESHLLQYLANYFINSCWIFLSSVSFLTIYFYLIRKPNAIVYFISIVAFLAIFPLYFSYVYASKANENWYASYFSLGICALMVLFLFFAITYKIRFFNNEEDLQRLITINQMRTLQEKESTELMR